MSDIFNKEQRSEIMSHIRSVNTSPEKLVRKLLRAEGLTGYRLHRKDLLGKPDIVFNKRKFAIFVHGCFWHGHRNCRRATIPANNHEKWANKIEQNRMRDVANISALLDKGWKVAVVWQCALLVKYQKALQIALKKFLDSDSQYVEFERKTFEKYKR